MKLKRKVEIRLPGGIEMKFRRIVGRKETAGKKRMVRFRMGSRDQDGGAWSREPVHWVTFTQPFYLGATPVTQAQYRAIAEQCAENLGGIEGNLGSNPSVFSGDELPVENVNWNEANAICAWLGNPNRLAEAGSLAGWIAGLPTEAQWEYACRAGSETEYWNGDGAEALADVGWFDRNSENQTRPVGSKPANPFGLHDLHGNVLEWCRDVWDEQRYCKLGAISDGSHCDAGEAGAKRALRGGGSIAPPGLCRASYRAWNGTGARSWIYGFRVCLFPGPEPGPEDQEKAGRSLRPEPGATGGSTEAQGAGAAGTATEIEKL